MRITNERQLKRRRFVYRVFALGSQSFVQKCSGIKGKIYYYRTLGKFWPYVKYQGDYGIVKFFLCDAGIPTKHNQHQTFTTLKEAENYLEWCLGNTCEPGY